MPYDINNPINRHTIKIITEIPFVDIKPYSHNIIGLQLEMMSKLFNTEDEFIHYIKNNFPELKELGWTQYWD